MIQVELYTRKECGLCDEAKAVLDRVRSQRPFHLVVVDVDQDAALAERYGLEVPVVLIEGRKAFKYHVDEHELVRKLRSTTPRSPG